MILNALTMKCPYTNGAELLTTYDPFDNSVRIRIKLAGSMAQPITDTDAAGTYTQQKIIESLEWLELGMLEQLEEFELTEAEVKKLITQARDTYLPSPNRDVTIHGFRIVIKFCGPLNFFDIMVDGKNYTDWKASNAFPYLMRLSVLDALKQIPPNEQYSRQLLTAFRGL